MSEPWVLGLAASHGGAACLMHGHTIVAAIQEERLTRVKYAPLAPAREFLALDYVLGVAGIDVHDLDLVVVCALHDPARGPNDLDRHPRLASRPRLTISHHLGHAISAYACSGFTAATVLVVDAAGSMVSQLTDAERAAVIGDGEREAVSIYDARDHVFTSLEKHVTRASLDPHTRDVRPGMMAFSSLGMMYQAAAEQVFGSWHDSGKLMGLAAYGHRRWPTADFFEIDGPELRFHAGISRHFAHTRRWPEERDAYRDLAASAQAALEDGLGHIVSRARQLGTSHRLCYAGGVALNVTANERWLHRTGWFTDTFVQPAAEDAGTAIGAAYFGVWHLLGRHEPHRMTTDALGRRYSDGEASDAADEVAELIEAGKVVAWFEGGAEFGPRALGHRSLIADPRRLDTKTRLDRLKRREPFRPYAPAALAERAHEWFEFGATSAESTFMLRALPVRPERRDCVPAIVHADGTGRLQTVPASSGGYRRLIEAFAARTGVPLVVNTSFNDRGHPIVETPEEALTLARAMGLDACAIDGVVYRF